MQNSKQISSVIGALIVGAAAGAALGILFAPHKGSKTRKRLTGKATDLVKNLKQQAKDQVKLLQENTEKLEDQASKHIAQTAKNINDGVDAVKTISNVAQAVTNNQHK